MIGLDFERCCNSLPHRFLFDVVVHHVLENSPRGGPFTQLDIRHHEVLFIFVTQHVLQVSLQFLSQKVASSNFLYFDYLQSSLIEVNLDKVPGSVSSVETLNEDARTVPLKNTSETVNVYFQIE